MDNNLSIKLREMARKQGLCDQWFGEWKDDTDNTALFDKYKRGIDFAIEHDYPSLEFIRSSWDKDELQSNNIFLDHKGIVCNNLKGTVVVNGESDITLDYCMFDTSDVYVRHNSKVVVNAKDKCRIMINLYDMAEATINCNDEARVYVYKHGDKCNIKSIGSKEPLIRISTNL